jgi:hypothetical protein
MKTTKTPAEMTEREIKDEIFSDESDREIELMRELARRGVLAKAQRDVDVTTTNEER